MTVLGLGVGKACWGTTDNNTGMSTELGEMSERRSKSTCSDSDGWIEVEPSAGAEMQGVDQGVDRRDSIMTTKGEGHVCVEQANCSETTEQPCAAPAQLPPSEASDDQFYCNNNSDDVDTSTSSSCEASAVEHVPTDAQSTAEEVPDRDQSLPARKWSQAECHMHDIRYAEKSSATIPKRVKLMKYKILVTGQPETGRTLTMKNLFASYVKDPEWSPKNTTGLDMDSFVQDPAQFETVIHDQEDEAKNMKTTYIIQETPGLKGDADEMAEILCKYVKSRQDMFAAEESRLECARQDLRDERVDVVLYFLPTNARISESDMDYKVINALTSYCPVLPVMCKADCLEQEEILQRKEGIQELMNNGLNVFQFPKDIIEAIEDTAHGVSHSDPLFCEPSVPQSGNPDFRLPFNIVAGAHIDPQVGQFWFVRNYRWAVCEAYRTSNSDLRLLRQLLLEEGFWAIKDEAEKRYRLHRLSPVEAQQPLTTASDDKESQVAQELGKIEYVPTIDGETSQVTNAISEGGTAKTDGLEVRQSCRRSPFLHLQVERSVGKPVRVASSKVPFLAASVSTRGLGAHPTTGKHLCSTSPPTTQQFLSINSEDTELSVPIGAGASALEALHEHHSSTEGCARPISSTGVPSHVPIPDEDTFDESTCFKAKVNEITRGMSRNYRLALRLEDNGKVLCLRIGESEGNSIAAALRTCSTSRPSAYDATAGLLESLGCKVKRVVVTECNNTIFYARVHAVNESSGKLVDVDARPSDAVNFAMRQNAPIFIHKDVVRQFAKSAP